MSAASLPANPSIFDNIEADAAGQKGPGFNGWLEGNFFVDGVCAQRIAGWLKADGMKRKGGGR